MDIESFQEEGEISSAIRRKLKSSFAWPFIRAEGRAGTVIAGLHQSDSCSQWEMQRRSDREFIVLFRVKIVGTFSGERNL